MELCRQCLHSFIRKTELLFDIGYTCLVQIGIDRHPVAILEKGEQVIFVDIEPGRQIVKGNFLPVVGVQIFLDLLNICSIRWILCRFLRIPGIFHEQDQERRELLVDPHIPDVVRGICDLIELSQDGAVFGKVLRPEDRASAPLLIFLVNGVHVGTVEMAPLEGPESIFFV